MHGKELVALILRHFIALFLQLITKLNTLFPMPSVSPTAHSHAITSSPKKSREMHHNHVPPYHDFSASPFQSAFPTKPLRVPLHLLLHQQMHLLEPKGPLFLLHFLFQSPPR